EMYPPQRATGASADGGLLADRHRDHHKRRAEHGDHQGGRRAAENRRPPAEYHPPDHDGRRQDIVRTEFDERTERETGGEEPPTATAVAMCMLSQRSIPTSGGWPSSSGRTARRWRRRRTKATTMIWTRTLAERGRTVSDGPGSMSPRSPAIAQIGILPPVAIRCAGPSRARFVRR